MRTYALEWEPAVQAWTIARAVREHTTNTEEDHDVVLQTWMDRLAAWNLTAAVDPTRPLSSNPQPESELVRPTKKRSWSCCSNEEAEPTSIQLATVPAKRTRVHGTTGATLHS